MLYMLKIAFYSVIVIGFLLLEILLFYVITQDLKAQAKKKASTASHLQNQNVTNKYQGYPTANASSSNVRYLNTSFRARP